MNGIELYVSLASGLWSTVYGYGEKMCGDVGRPVVCDVGATTASGDPFDPAVPSVAVAAPLELRIQATYVWLRLVDVAGAMCVRLRVNDKMHPRYIGERGFDLSPAAVRKLGGTPSPKWGGRVEVCRDEAVAVAAEEKK